MKNLFKLSIALFLVTGLFSCKKNTEMSATATGTLQENLIAGNWKITYLYTDNTNKTDEYTGYLFTFDSDGFSAVSNPLMAVNGSWSVTQGAAEKPVLHLEYTNSLENSSFGVFPGDWTVEAQDNYHVALQRTAGHGTEQLNIERLK